MRRRRRARPRSEGDRADRRARPSPDCGCCASTTPPSSGRGVAAIASSQALGVDVVLVSPHRAGTRAGASVDLEVDGDAFVVAARHAREPPLRVRVRPTPDLAGAAVAPLRRDRRPRGAGQPGRGRGMGAGPAGPEPRRALPVQRAEPPQALPRAVPLDRAGRAAPGGGRPHLQRRGRLRPAGQGLQRRRAQPRSRRGRRAVRPGPPGAAVARRIGPRRDAGRLRRAARGPQGGRRPHHGGGRHPGSHSRSSVPAPSGRPCERAVDAPAPRLGSRSDGFHDQGGLADGVPALRRRRGAVARHAVVGRAVRARRRRGDGVRCGGRGLAQRRAARCRGDAGRAGPAGGRRTRWPMRWPRCATTRLGGRSSPSPVRARAATYAWPAVARRQLDFYRQLDWFAP